MKPVSKEPAADTVIDGGKTAQSELLSAMLTVSETLVPLWPLRDYVAANPLDGLTNRPFLVARAELRACADVETLMPLSYFREKYQQGFLTEADIRKAARESGTSLPAGRILAAVRGNNTTSSDTGNDERVVKALCEVADQSSDQGWREFIVSEVGRFCADYYDEGVAAWKHPWKNVRLYEAWRQQAQHNLGPEIQGLTGFRQFARSLPVSPEAAVTALLRQLDVPGRLWGRYLTCVAHLLPGWASWAMHALNESEKVGCQTDDLSGLMAVILAHEVAIAGAMHLHVDWNSISALVDGEEKAPRKDLSATEAEIRHVLQQATEGVYRQELVHRLTGAADASETDGRPPVEAVFCIDVRSERLRRNLHTVDPQISTGGFAGFFGVPVSFQENREEAPRPYLPAILKPSFGATGKGPERGQLAEGWQHMRKSATAAFGFVELAGLLHLGELARRCWTAVAGSVSSHPAHAPELHTCGGGQLSLSEKTELATSILTGLGRTRGHGRLFVFCGHGARTINNPLNASLACGACGGHNGGVNASLAARLLNDAEVREALLEEGFAIPHDTVFAAAEHDTVGDHVTILDEDQIPASHYYELQRFMGACEEAAGANRIERARDLAVASPEALAVRAFDWAEIRPEWGLAGNAALIAAPRSRVRADLSGRAFLHDYDESQDLDHGVLKQILTGPLMVAHWINMQYYTSAVDNRAFGSGTKTLHNVTGLIGVQSGAEGDLKFGLPVQALADHSGLRHEPIRLQAIIAAQRDAIDGVLSQHPGLEELSNNEWLALIAWENDTFYRRSHTGQWIEERLPTGLNQPETTVAKAPAAEMGQGILQSADRDPRP